jgi:hypothetical protein
VNTAEESMTIDDYMSFVALNTTNDAGAGDNNEVNPESWTQLKGSK